MHCHRNAPDLSQHSPISDALSNLASHLLIDTMSGEERGRTSTKRKSNPNWGGARTGAGRKKKAPMMSPQSDSEPEDRQAEPPSLRVPRRPISRSRPPSEASASGFFAARTRDRPVPAVMPGSWLATAAANPNADSIGRTEGNGESRTTAHSQYHFNLYLFASTNDYYS